MISAKLNHSLFFTSFELLDAILSFEPASFCLLVIYRPPPAPNYVFFEEFKQLVGFVESSRKKQKLLIVGDLNIHLDDLADIFASRLSTLINELQIFQLIVVATHVAGHTLYLTLSFKSERFVSRPCVGQIFSDHHLVG